MGACSSNVLCYPSTSYFTYENLYLGDYVNVGQHADFVSTRSKIIMKDHVVFGPHVGIRGGDHRIGIIGEYVDMVTGEIKLPENDQVVCFEDDNWVGMNATILKGVVIGKGCIVAVGAVVPPPTVL